MSNHIRTIYRHLHDPSLHETHGSMTIRVDVDLANDKFLQTIARCSPSDNFSKKKGREIVDERFSRQSTLLGAWNIGLNTIENVEVALRNEIAHEFKEESNQELKQQAELIKAYKVEYIVQSWFTA